jgi:hypothetical protein
MGRYFLARNELPVGAEPRHFHPSALNPNPDAHRQHLDSESGTQYRHCHVARHNPKLAVLPACDIEPRDPRLETHRYTVR